jgi:hypothetical protein
MKKLNSAFIIVFITISISNIYFAQSNNNLDYFPHNDGDMWEYFFYDGPLYVDTAQVFNHYDSTDAEGNIFVTQTSRYINPIVVHAIPFPERIQYKIDTLNQVWAHFGEVEYGIAFKLNAKQGDQWILQTYYDNSELIGYEMARVGLIYEKNYFGKIYTVMNTYYYFTTDTTDTLGLSRYGQDLAKGLGCVWLGGGDIIGRMDLRGAVIDGVLYGDTTNVITSVENYNDSIILPITLELEQNYPNPFNAGTTINFTLSRFTSISLVIYNIEGKEVNRLLYNKDYLPGNYSIYWDGKNKYNQIVSSGVYFYSILQNSKPVKTKSMILLK